MNDLVLADCTIVDATGSEPAADAAVWIHDQRIEAVGPTDAILSRARSGGEPNVVDLAGATVLPGLVNMHTHFSDPARADAAREVEETQASLTLRMARNAREALHAGVTTVRLVAEPHGIDFVLRQAINRGEVEGPRIYTAGRGVICTGGHGFAFAGTIEADGAAGFRHAVRSQLKQGADLIKLMISGGIAGEHEGMDTPQLAPDELRAVTEIAHAWGRKVTAHAGPAGAIREAIECGLDCVEHGYELDRVTVKLMAERGVTLVPTLLVTRCREFYERVGAPEWMVERAMAAGSAHEAGVRAAVEEGVAIALGTDMLPGEPYEGTSGTVRELEYLVEVAGMSAHDALRAATTVGAEWLGAGDDIGTIEPGKLGDLIAVDGDPLSDVSSLRKLLLVVKGGAVVRDVRAA